MQKGNSIILAAVALIFIGIIGFIYTQVSKPGAYDNLAACLQEKEVKFYGAFWCPACQKQKTLFGKSEKLLPYVECSTPSGDQQTQECKDKDIKSYPTWIFANNEVLNKTLTPEELAEKTNCPLI